jgi:hypothetical protein
MLPIFRVIYHQDLNVSGISVTELLDLAPVGFFSTISYNFLKNLPPLLVSDDVKAKALDIQFHWVTENGQSLAHLTGNLHVSPTVRPIFVLYLRSIEYHLWSRQANKKKEKKRERF